MRRLKAVGHKDTARQRPRPCATTTMSTSDGRVQWLQHVVTTSLGASASIVTRKGQHNGDSAPAPAQPRWFTEGYAELVERSDTRSSR